ncbi:hypothetical protein KDW_50800 [Dictyobacter vulcani]|uniref:Major facilitator superfamily (MFS) profile domain-containing protein n=1 Tax=Dictyobacter vulcani TaxID=2607529 RepID=A0A5J4KMH4_9CHLR|nr:MFS transporter [Dictyobacter vulcani]GER90918.1 hypothetical protein KDW_50800 [Dictyobacter vulcani]
MFWGGAFGMLLGVILVLFSHQPVFSIAGMFVIGFLGTFLMVTIQSSLSDLHGIHRATAITEANVVGSLGAGLAPLCLGGLVTLGMSWRSVLFVPIAIVVLLALFYWKVPVPEAQSYGQPRSVTGPVRLPAAFWLYWLAMVMGVGVEWGISFWGSGYLINVVGLERANAATLMSLFFLAAVIGRLIGSHLTQRFAVERLLLPTLLVALTGFLLFWLGPLVELHMVGLFVVGLGICNLFPFTFSASANRIPQYADLASARAALGGGIAIFVAPLILGRIADMLDLKRAYSVILILFVLVGIFIVLAAQATRKMDAVASTEPVELSESSVEFSDSK